MSSDEIKVEKIQAIKDTFQVSVGGSIIGHANSEAEGRELAKKYLSERG